MQTYLLLVEDRLGIQVFQTNFKLYLHQNFHAVPCSFILCSLHPSLLLLWSLAVISDWHRLTEKKAVSIRERIPLTSALLEMDEMIHQGYLGPSIDWMLSAL